MKLEITPEKLGKRIDIVISDLISDSSRSRIQKLIKDGKVLLSGESITDPSKKISEIGIIEIDECETENNYEITPEAIDLKVVFEDEYIVIIDKAAGMVCHPAPGHRSGTLVNAITHHFKNSLSDIGGKTRAGIIHRLDKDTSGLILIAKTNAAHAAFANLFANEKGNLIKRKYTCFVFGIPSPKSGKIETFITRHPKNRQMFAVHESRGKLAITLYETKKSKYFTSTKAISKIDCELLTGRTHQIRVHMKHIGHNIIGDPVYGKNKVEAIYPQIIREFPRQALHSRILEFQHPFSKQWMIFESDLPEDMKKLDEILES